YTHVASSTTVNPVSGKKRGRLAGSTGGGGGWTSRTAGGGCGGAGGGTTRLVPRVSATTRLWPRMGLLKTSACAGVCSNSAVTSTDWPGPICPSHTSEVPLTVDCPIVALVPMNRTSSE